MTEFGNLALIDQDAGEENGVAVPLPGVRKGEQKSPALPPPTFLVTLLLPPLGLCLCLHWDIFLEPRMPGLLKGRGTHTFVPHDQCQGPPRQTMPVTVAQEPGVPLCRLPLD